MKFIIEHIQPHGKQLKSLSHYNREEGASCYYNIVSPSNKVQCDDCKRDISKSAKIMAPDNDYCISCLACLEQFPSTYSAINKLDYPLFDQDWTADQQLMLFQGLQKHGFGNWEDIANTIGTNKTPGEVEVHYCSHFLESKDFLPAANVLSVRDETGKLMQIGMEEEPKRLGKPLTRIFSSHSIPSFQRGSLTVNQMSSGLKSGTNPAEIVGYMPKRGDFQVEFDNDAQLLLAEMEFNEDDSEEAIQMKFRLIDIYNQKLTERVRRKEFVISRKLLDLKEQARLDKTRTKEEKEIYSMMKVFARFSHPEQHEQLVQGFIKEKQIRSRLAELRDIKKKGFKSVSDLSEQLSSKKKKEERIKKDPIFMNADKSRIPPGLGHKKSKKDSHLQKSSSKTHFFSAQQVQLCTRFSISLTEFQIIKQSIIRSFLQQNILELDEASKLFKVNRSTMETILDFIVQKQVVVDSQ